VFFLIPSGQSQVHLSSGCSKNLWCLFGSRLDVSGDDLPGLKDLLVSKKLLQLKDIIDKAGLGLKKY